MSIGTILNNLVIGPLELLLEVLFSVSNRVLNEGLSIVVLSLAVNILVLPLYHRADAMQEEERNTEAKLAPMVKHIRSSFRGDEQLMILQTYYRQNHYSPLHTLKGAVPLLLQIPFFIAAYQFLSQLGCLQGTAFGPISDLSKPDQLLKIGEITLNVLPILMTLINLASGALYTRGAPIKSKVQLWIMALVFLIVLYESSAGLTFYWTLNNLFSLGKNIIQKIFPGQKERIIDKPGNVRPRTKVFVLCCAFLAVLTGLLIPSSVLVSSPQDFINYMSAPNPMWYMINAFILAMGTFVLWLGVYYVLGTPGMKKGMEYLTWIASGISLINFLAFRNNLGTISSTLKYDLDPVFTLTDKIINLGVVVLTALIFFFAMRKKESLVRGIAWTMLLTMSLMAGRNLWISGREIAQGFQAQKRNYSGEMEIPLSRQGDNVIVLMLDRAVSSYLPCILYERPELKEVYSGFIYYPNTLSYGAHTNLGAPAIFGGYEYVPREMNARNTELLKDKHNEALLLMPTLFSQQNYRISVFDVPYPGNYTISGDYSVFDGLPDANARILSGSSELSLRWEETENLQLRNFFCYSLSRVVPTVLYGTLYDWGNYNRANGAANFFSFQKDDSGEKTQGMDLNQMEFMAEYEVLCNLKRMTKVLPEKTNTLLVMANLTTHLQFSLPEPEYAPVRKAENEAYDAEHKDRFLAGPLPLLATTEYQMQHYQTNMAALLKVGEWLEYLKEMGVYDNTRIILVADHGAVHLQIPQGVLETGVDSVGFNAYGSIEDIMSYNPLLMVKDFGATGEVQTDTGFMTNADVPTIAMKGLISNPVNPFTGNPVDDRNKWGVNYVSFSHLSGVGRDAGTTFDPAYWFAVTPGGKTLFDPERWTVVPELQ